MPDQKSAAELLADREITDDIQEALDDLVHDAFDAAASKAANRQMDDSHNDDIHDSYSASASELNNRGPEAQIAWLLEEGVTEGEILEALGEAAAAPEV